MAKWHDVREEPAELEYGYSHELFMEVRLFAGENVYCTGYKDLRKNKWATFPSGMISEFQDVRRWAYLNDVLEALDNG